MKEMPIWEKYATDVCRLKVDGGYLYSSFRGNSESMCFVPDVDLQRYQSHLRDAYRQGYTAGQEDAKHGINDNV
jgi:hypothetical protein